MSRLARTAEFVLPVGIVACLLVILVPLPAAVMDLLLAANITVAVVILLTTVFVRAPIEFSVFPTVLLATTLSRLVLNVATTRLILTRAADEELLAAGGVVKSFGQFVSGDQIAVGIIIFAIIFVIQFVVITSGATRISEVAARFALDGMPGRQMAVDADLAAGTINDKQAQHRRDEIHREADFYGSMDGASKFVRGDAVAGVFITLINIAGGFFIGVVQSGMSIGDAASIYTKLTIGDGLVSQVPARLVSLAAGLLVTRGSHRTNLPNEFLRQLFARPQVLAVAACFLGLLVLTDLPRLPLLVLGGGCVGLAVFLRGRSPQAVQPATSSEKKARPKKPDPRIEDHLLVHPVELEVGVSLVRFADPQRGGDLLNRITSLRQMIAGELGLVMPKVRVRDNLRLGENAYRIMLSGNPVSEATLRADVAYAMPPSPRDSSPSESLGGLPTYEHPAFDRPVATVLAAEARALESRGYHVYGATAVIAQHLRRAVHEHASELLTRDATRHLLDELKKSSPAVVDELVPRVMTLGEVQAVLQGLLREGVPIRQLGIILEAIADHAQRPNDVVGITEAVRQRLGRTISSEYRNAEFRLQAVTFDPELESFISVNLHDQGSASTVVERLCRSIERQLLKLNEHGGTQIVVVGGRIRRLLKQITSDTLPRLVVLSYPEVTRETRLASVGIVTLEDVVGA